MRNIIYYRVITAFEGNYRRLTAITGFGVGKGSLDQCYRERETFEVTR